MAFLPFSVLQQPAGAIPLACMLIPPGGSWIAYYRLAPGRARSNAGNWRLMVRLPVWRNAHEEATLDRMKVLIVDDHEASEPARAGCSRRTDSRSSPRPARVPRRFRRRDMEPGGGAPRRTSTRHAGLRSCGAPPRERLRSCSRRPASSHGLRLRTAGRAHRLHSQSELSGEALRRILDEQASTDRDRNRRLRRRRRHRRARCEQQPRRSPRSGVGPWATARLVVHRNRPLRLGPQAENGTRALMVAVGFAWFLSTLVTANSELVFRSDWS